MLTILSLRTHEMWVVVQYAVYLFTPERPGGRFFFFKQYSFFTIGNIDLYYAPIKAELSEVFPCVIF